MHFGGEGTHWECDFTESKLQSTHHFIQGDDHCNLKTKDMCVGGGGSVFGYNKPETKIVYTNYDSQYQYIGIQEIIDTSTFIWLHTISSLPEVCYLRGATLEWKERYLKESLNTFPSLLSLSCIGAEK